MTEDLYSRLRGLLEREQHALRTGAIEDLGDMLEEKQELALALQQSQQGPQRVEVLTLRAMAETNAAMLEAAKRGIKAASERTAERFRVAGHLDTYDASGQRQSYTATTEVSRRA